MLHNIIKLNSVFVKMHFFSKNEEKVSSGSSCHVESVKWLYLSW